MNIWRLHPKSMKIEKAEKTLMGTANPEGVKWCRPFTMANSIGFWVFPAVDMDVKWDGNKFDYRILENYSPNDHELARSLAVGTNIDVEMFCPSHTGRSKFTWSAVEPNVVQLWTGCIFETPPGYCLQVRNPINFPSRGFRVMEGVLETDWMQYDVWINLAFDVKDTWIEIRKNGWPMAQLVPMKRESLEGNWKINRDELLSRTDADSNRVADYWLQYNEKKFCSGGKQKLSEDRTKDSTTYFKERSRIMGKGSEPKPKEIVAKPLSNKKNVKLKLLKLK